MTEAHKEIIRRYVEDAINTRNLSVLDEFIHPNYVYRSPTEELNGLEGIKGFIGRFIDGFPDSKMRLDDLVVEGDKAVSCFTITGTHKGDFAGIAATGKPIEIHGMVLSRFENGKIVEEWEIMDQLALLQQLGVVSLPK